MLKTSYEIIKKTEHGDMSFLFHNGYSIQETNCMQSIEHISKWEVFRTICPYNASKAEMDKRQLRSLPIAITVTLNHQGR